MVCMGEGKEGGGRDTRVSGAILSDSTGQGHAQNSENEPADQ